MIDMRDAVWGFVLEKALEDRNVVVLVNDMGAYDLAKLKEQRPDQYYNMGPQEQNMVAVATGLALSGKRVFIYGIANFVTLRCYEQIKNDICAHNAAVTIVGTSPGYTYGAGGSTHHATEDLEIMSLLPNMTVYHPADGVCARACIEMAYEAQTPHYLCIERAALPTLYPEGLDFSPGYGSWGQNLGPEYRPAEPLVASGYMVHVANEVADLLAAQGINIGVVDQFRWSPNPMFNINLRERAPSFWLGIGSREYTHESLGLDAKSIVERVKEGLYERVGLL